MFIIFEKEMAFTGGFLAIITMLNVRYCQLIGK